MKTRLFVVIIIFLVVVSAGYLIFFGLLAPSLPQGNIRLYTSSDGAYRTLIKQENWDKFSPNTFTITRRLNYHLELLTILNKVDSITISIGLIPLSSDSVKVFWFSNFPHTSFSPTVKLKQWSQYNEVKTKMDDALSKFQHYVSNNENIYGTRIVETSTKDTLLLTTRFSSSSLPSNELIYSNINKLRAYANAKGAQASGSPMLNISTTDSSIFNCMVALPVNKIVDGNNTISFVRMVPGHFLTTTVTGGPYTIKNAHRMMDQYFKDFNRVTMAIPFEYLVTDRLKDTDTSKWVTRIYGPVY
jgi:hypothetical protein